MSYPHFRHVATLWITRSRIFSLAALAFFAALGVAARTRAANNKITEVPPSISVAPINASLTNPALTVITGPNALTAQPSALNTNLGVKTTEKTAAAATLQVTALPASVLPSAQETTAVKTQGQDKAKSGETQATVTLDELEEGRLKFDNAAKRGGLEGDQFETALAIMTKSADNTSRTTAVGRKYFTADKTNAQVQDRAKENFKKAAAFVLNNFGALDLNLETTIALNKILTEGLVPEKVRGNPNFHRDSDKFYRLLPGDLERLKDDPVGLAEFLHNRISRLDSFPDGNGRTARLMADIALLKAGLAPAFYTSMEDYFARGNHRTKKQNEELRAYFEEVVARGQKVMANPKLLNELDGAKGLDDAFVRKVTSDPGHSGLPTQSRRDTHDLKKKP